MNMRTVLTEFPRLLSSSELFLVPAEGAILRLWSHVEEVEVVDISWYTCFLSIGLKHTHPTTLGELSVLIVQILCVCA